MNSTNTDLRHWKFPSSILKVKILIPVTPREESRKRIKVFIYKYAFLDDL